MRFILNFTAITLVLYLQTTLGAPVGTRGIAQSLEARAPMPGQCTSAQSSSCGPGNGTPRRSIKATVKGWFRRKPKADSGESQPPHTSSSTDSIPSVSNFDRENDLANDGLAHSIASSTTTMYTAIDDSQSTYSDSSSIDSDLEMTPEEALRHENNFNKKLQASRLIGNVGMTPEELLRAQMQEQSKKERNPLVFTGTVSLGRDSDKPGSTAPLPDSSKKQGKRERIKKWFGKKLKRGEKKVQEGGKGA